MFSYPIYQNNDNSKMDDLTPLNNDELYESDSSYDMTRNPNSDKDKNLSDYIFTAPLGGYADSSDD